MPLNHPHAPQAPRRPDNKHVRLDEIRQRTDLRRAVTEAPVVDLEARTVDLSFSSTTEVPRWFGIEILSHAPGAMRTGRLNADAPLLWMHNTDDQRGKVVPGSVRLDGNKGRAKVKFSRSAAGEQLFQDVQDAIVTNVSVGYFVLDAQLIEVRDDGTDVWLITDWEPYEISMVSVPADIAVGAGRSAEIPKEESLRTGGQSHSIGRTVRHLEAQRTMKPLDELRTLLEDSKHQHGITVFDRDSGQPPAIHRRAPGTAASFSLRELETATQAATAGGITITEHKAGELIPVSAAIAERSRVAQAGARILVVDPASEARPVGQGTGVLGFDYTKTQVIAVDAAPFALVSESDPELSESAAPVSRIYVGYDGSGNDTFGGPSYGVRFKLTRRQMKDVPADQLLQELLLSITMGLARAADHALLTAIGAGTPAAFTLAAAAAAGLEFGQLRALVGTNGAAAAVGQDGTLRAAGIPAELTPVMAPTVVGSFASASVAVHDSLRIAIQRTGVAGDAFVTCWAAFEALLPDASFFWTAA